MTLDGFWTAEFASSEGLFGGGVVLLHDGIVTGGDSGYVFSGNITFANEQNADIEATVQIEPFLKNQISVFNTLGRKLTLNIVGRLTSENLIVGHGSPQELPNSKLSFKLSRRVAA